MGAGGGGECCNGTACCGCRSCDKGTVASSADGRCGLLFIAESPLIMAAKSRRAAFADSYRALASFDIIRSIKFANEVGIFSSKKFRFVAGLDKSVCQDNQLCAGEFDV